MPEEIDPLDHYANVGRRLLELREMLAARQGNPAYDENRKMLKAEITNLENLQRSHAPADLGAEQ